MLYQVSFSSDIQGATILQAAPGHILGTESEITVSCLVQAS